MRDAVGPRHRARATSSSRPGAPRRQIAPVADTYADLFVNMAHHLRGAVARPRARCARRSSGCARRSRQGIRSFPVQRPFLARLGELSRRLRARGRRDRALAAARRRDALEVGHAGAGEGADALPQHRERVPRARRARGEPEHAAGAAGPATAPLEVAAPLVELRGAVPDGLQLLELLLDRHRRARVRAGARRHRPSAPSCKSDNRTPGQPPDRLRRPTGRWTCPPGQDPITAPRPRGRPARRRCTGAPTSPAIDAQGNADCQVGQRGYLTRPVVTDGRYPPSTDPTRAAAATWCSTPTCPGWPGRTYKARELGIDNLKDVP